MKIINGYRIEETIGEGSLSKVKRAVRLADQQPVAIKTFYHCTLRKKIKDGHAKLLREYQLVRGLDHPNVIKYYDLFQDHDKVYLVMQLCADGHLSAAAAAGANVKHYLRQLLAGLEYLHANRVFHHDLKPANLLLDHQQNSSLVIADFGVAEYDKNSLCYSCFGTPAFQPPEVVNLDAGASYDGAAADIWSAGLVLYFLLTGGELLFSGDTVYAVLQAISNCHEDPPCLNIEEEDNREFLLLFLKLNPKERWSASQLLQHKWLY